MKRFAFVLIQFFMSVFTYSQTQDPVSLTETANKHLKTGEILDEVHKLDSALIEYTIAADMFLKLKDTASYLNTCTKRGDLFSYDGQFEKALDYYLNAISVGEKFSKKSPLCKLYRYIGWTYKDLKSIKQSRLYYDKALELATKINDEYELFYSYSYLTILYTENKMPDSVYKFVCEQEKYVKAVKDNYGALSVLYQNKAFSEFYQKNYTASEKSRLLSLEMTKKGQLNYDLALSYYNVAEIYYALQNYSKGLIYNDSASSINKTYPNINASLPILKLYIKLYTKTKDYKTALDYSKEYIMLKDSILSEDMNNKIAKMQTRFDLESKNLKIKLLNEESIATTAELEKKEQRIYFFIIVALLFVCISAISFFAYQKKKQDNILLKAQRNEIIEKTKQLNIQAAEIAKHQSQMNPHFIFNALISIQKFILKENKQTAIGYLSNLSKLMRLTLYNSEKEFIALKQEIDFLNFYVDFELQRFENSFSFEIIIPNTIDVEETMIPPMILQPFIENSIKHGISALESKGRIQIKIGTINHSGKEALLIEIEDNGIGREASKAMAQKFNADHESMAMTITKKRIEVYAEKYNLSKANLLLVSDIFDFDNTPAGTRVTLILPMI